MVAILRTGYLWYGRFIAAAVLLYTGFLLIVTLANLVAGAVYDSGRVIVWILASAIAGVGGALIFALSLDGPVHFRTRIYRLGGWMMMLASVLLPSVITLVLAPLTVLALGLVLIPPEKTPPSTAK